MKHILRLATCWVTVCSMLASGADIYEYETEQDFIHVEGDSSQGLYYEPPADSYPTPSYENSLRLKQIPAVKLSSQPGWEQLNTIAWRAFYDHIREPSVYFANGKHIPARPSSQFSDHEFFWDQAFIYMGFARYAFVDPNSQGGLDAFYSAQHVDGYIPREIMANGTEVRFFRTQNLLVRLDSPPPLIPEPLSRFGTVNRLHRYVAKTVHSYLYRDQAREISRQVEALKNIYTLENNTNPPLAAHAEWQHYLLSRDKGRLKSVIKALRKHTDWLEKNRQIHQGPLKGLFWQRTMASGMDNMPSQFNHWKKYQQKAAEQESPDYQQLAAMKNDASFDISAQMKLHYDAMLAIEDELGEFSLAMLWWEKSNTLKKRINHCMWDDKQKFYFNVSETCESKDITFSLSGYWALYAKVATDSHARAMIPYLSKRLYFNTYMPFTTLAAMHPEYSSDGHYWQGGVWPPLNYITLKGLLNYAHIAEAWDIAVTGTERYLNHLHTTMVSPVEGKTAATMTNKDFKHNIYEYNSPETGGPGKGPDAQGDYVGWGGLGPIALMQEVAIGINVHKDEIVWHLNRTDMHGIENMNIGQGSLSLQVNKHQDGSPLGEHHFSIRQHGLSEEGIKSIRVIEKSSGNTIVFPINSLEQ